MHKTQISNPVGRSSSQSNPVPQPNLDSQPSPAPLLTTNLPQHTTSPSKSNLGPNSIQPGTEQRLPNPESEKHRDSYGRSGRDPGQGWYCGICYANMTTLGVTVSLLFTTCQI